MLSIVMPAFNEGQCLDLTLQSLEKQELERDAFEVVVVDDCSNEDLSPLVEKHAGLNLKYVKNTRNRGRAVSRNVGIQNADSDVVLFLDSDSFAHPGLLKRHDDFHRSTRKRKVLLGTRYELNWRQLEQIFQTGNVDHSTLTYNEDDLRASMIEQRYQDLYLESAWLLAYTHNMSVPKDLLVKAGMFDENLRGWGLEDGEMAYRVSRLEGDLDGFDFDREAVCYHLPHLKNFSRIGFEYFQNQAYLKGKYFGFEFEIFSWGAADCIKKVPYYREMTGFCAESHFGAFSPSLLQRLAVKPNSRVLLMGSDTVAVKAVFPANVRTIDYGLPLSWENPHFIGLNTNFGNREFHQLICVDLWRLLIWVDLNQFLKESLRVAAEVVFVYTKNPKVVPPPTTGLNFLNNIDYLFRTMRNHLKVTTLFEDEEVLLFKVGEY